MIAEFCCSDCGTVFRVRGHRSPENIACPECNSYNYHTERFDSRHDNPEILDLSEAVADLQRRMEEMEKKMRGEEDALTEPEEVI